MASLLECEVEILCPFVQPSAVIRRGGGNRGDPGIASKMRHAYECCGGFLPPADHSHSHPAVKVKGNPRINLSLVEFSFHADLTGWPLDAL